MRQIDSVRKSSNFQKVLERSADTMAATLPPVVSISPKAMPLAHATSVSSQISAAAESLATPAAGEFPGFRGVQAGMEAIILAEMRPPYFIIRDEIVINGDYDHMDLIKSNKARLEGMAKRVGRVDLLHHATNDFVGTGWLIEKDVIVTNRHVAEFFADMDQSGRYNFKPGVGSEPLEVMMDYVREHQTTGVAPRRAFATEVIYIAAANEPDFAFLKVQPLPELDPLAPAARRAEPDQPVAAIGYPAWDGNRNDPQLMGDLFGNVYNVKRFSPGLVTGSEESGVILHADYTSLGGNSGSGVVDLATGDIVGLHFAGVFRETNYLVAADIVWAALRRMRTVVAMSAIPTEAPTSQVDTFAGREGYKTDFLGAGELAVPLPDPGKWKNDIAPVKDDGAGTLKYEHFSTVQSRSRRLPLFTAVNIDGGQQRKLNREGDWKLDARLELAHQVGNELYRNNRLDRGHMVRRRDPGWGSESDAIRGEADTFHYTNSVPQHEDLNQKDWVRLEDYLLLAAETRGFKACVFTGPVFRDTDKRLRNQPGAEDIQIPEEFWKVAVMINADTDKLHATAYVLSHGPLIRDMTEAAFVFGQHETYQVPITLIERATGLDFGALRKFDPLGQAGATESKFGSVVRRIMQAADLLL